jgi:CubicO group peptidase (beta-lactamase class C family)
MTFDAQRLSRIDTHFRQYVDDGRLAGWQIHLEQHGEVVHSSHYGLADIASQRPVAEDTLWRIYSMTKPIVSVVAMQLWEQGLFELTDPISRFIPSFGDVQVWADGSNTKAFVVPPTEPIRMWHLLTHTSGLSYGFLQVHPVDAMYRAAGYEFDFPQDKTLEQVCDDFARLPLRFHPGSGWGYGHSTDVLGRVLEVLTGKPLEQVVSEQLLDPLGMTDTRWHVEGPDRERLASLYAVTPDGLVRHEPLEHKSLNPTAPDGGGGLVSSAADYARFTRTLLRRGELDGVRVLGPRTVALMTRNHLPGGKDLGALISGGFAETVFEGIGFGLGFAVMLDPTPSKSAASVGDFFWGGLASTAFWVDPSTGITAGFYTQLMPSSTYPIRAQLRQLVSSALLD